MMNWCPMVECDYGSWDLDRKYDTFADIAVELAE